MTAPAGSVLVALAIVLVLALLAYRIRSSPGGPFMFSLRHPKVAVVLAAAFFGFGGAFLIGDALRELPPAAESTFRQYLFQVGGLGLVCGLVNAVNAMVRGPRNAREAAANFGKTMRFMGSGYSWIGFGLVPAAIVVAEWFNPVPSARFGLAGIVSILGFLAPIFLVQLARAFLFPSTLPSVSGVADAFLEDSPNGSSN